MHFIITTSGIRANAKLTLGLKYDWLSWRWVTLRYLYLELWM